MRIRTALIGAALLAAAVGLAVTGSSTYGPPPAPPAPAPLPAHIELVAAHSLIGRPVRDRQGTALGTLADLLADAATGRLRSAVVRPFGTPSSGNSDAVIPWSQLAVPRDAKAPLHLSIGAARFRLERRAVGLGASPGIERSAVGQAWKPVMPEAHDGSVPLPGEPPTPSIPLRVSAMRGASIMPSDGGTIGTVEEVELDAAHHQLAYVVARCDKCGTTPPPAIALPYRALAWSRQQHLFVLVADASEIRSLLPLLTGPQWHDGATAADLAALYRAFGFAPYWQVDAAGAAAAPPLSLRASPRRVAADR